MIWGPFLLALALGLMVSAGLYFAYLWPQVEPEEPVGGAPEAKPSDPDKSESAEASDKKIEPAPDRPIEEEPEAPPASKPEKPPGEA